jgi:hypothetical protein
MSSEDATISPALLDDYLERTVRMEAFSLPPGALPDDDGPTLIAAPATIAALAAASAPPPVPARDAARQLPEREDPAMRRAVIGIWAVAALLFATLGLLVR